MKTNYGELWRRAQKHLDDDVSDVFVYGEKDSEAMTASSLDGMVNAYHSLKYLLMAMLHDSGESFEIGAELHILLDSMLMADAYPVVKENILWAYEMENWDSAYVLQDDDEPYLEPLSYDDLRKVSQRIYKLECVYEGEEVSADW